MDGVGASTLEQVEAPFCQWSHGVPARRAIERYESGRPEAPVQEQKRMKFGNMNIDGVILRGAAGVYLSLVMGTALAGDQPAPPPPYTVVDGYKVDHETMEGFRTWRAAGCDRCHGANQEGLVGPSLVESLKTLSNADFKKTLTEGRLEKGMPSWSSNPRVMNNIDRLYSYLKGRSDGAITQARVEELQPAAAQ